MRGDRIVTTFDGTKAPRSQCNYIKSKFYIRNKQCFLVNDKWNRIDNGLIAFDYELGKWVKKSEHNLVYGIVGVNPDGSKKMGYFSIKTFKNVKVVLREDIKDPHHMSHYNCIAESVAKQLGLTEAINDGQFYNAKAFTSEENQILREKRPPDRQSTYSFPFLYGSEESIDVFSGAHDKMFTPVTPVIRNRHCINLPYTYGVEFETDCGTIPERHLWRNGLIACRDGSINGFEYVTVPLKGTKGLETLFNITHLLSRYTAMTIYNSLHIHLGGYPIRKKSIIALYRLFTRVQDEIYNMFPINYRNTSIFKGKSYCGPLKNIGCSSSKYEYAFGEMYKYISGGYEFEGFDFREHPMDRSGRQKWNVNPRYKWVNLIPLLFGDRKTIEFRVHTPTSNRDKVVYWLFITTAILNYARKHQSSLLRKVITIPTSLSHIISDSYHEDRKFTYNILTYIERRKKFYISQSNDPSGTGKTEIDNDHDVLVPRNIFF